MLNYSTDFENIYKENFDKLYKVAFRITGNKEDAEDALQDAYINAYKGFSNFKGESSVSVWLYRITVNSSLRFIKKIKKLPIVNFCSESGLSENDFFEKLKSIESVEDNVLLINVRETCLQLFINCMPKKQRITFVLKVLMDLSIDDVSKIMNISKSAVKINVHRVKMLTKALIEGRCSLLNPNGSCSCSLWVNYAVKYDKISKVTSFKCSKEVNPELKSLIFSEIGFLNKLAILYKYQPEDLPKDDFISKMKNLIEKSDLRVFE